MDKEPPILLCALNGASSCMSAMFALKRMDITMAAVAGAIAVWTMFLLIECAIILARKP